MNPIPLVLAILILAFQNITHAAPKIAVVRVKDIYSAQPAIKATQETAQLAKEKMLLDPRAEELRSAIEALREIQAKISDRSNAPTNEDGRKLAKEFEIKRLETKSLQEDFEKYRSTREREINEKMVSEMRRVLNLIVLLSQKIAEEKGCDLVFDSSGFTNSSVPFILHVKDAPDLTDDVMAAMKAEEQPKEAPTPPTPPESNPR